MKGNLTVQCTSVHVFINSKTADRARGERDSFLTKRLFETEVIKIAFITLSTKMGHKSKRFKNSSDVQIQITDFKSSFKHFKRRDPPPEFDKIVDVQNVKFSQYFEKTLTHQSDLVIENANDETLTAVIGKLQKIIKELLIRWDLRQIRTDLQNATMQRIAMQIALQLETRKQLTAH